jgi:hypothetical protein
VLLNAVAVAPKRWMHSPISSVDEVMSMLPAVRAALDERLLPKLLKDGYDGESPWGWKNPRTCITLPLFREVFPEARLLHIVRNEDDIAESFMRRIARRNRTTPGGDYWRDLTRQYVGRVREFGKASPFYCEFTYEDFCLKPIETCRPIFEFIGVPFTADARRFLEERVYTDRIGSGRKG